MAEQSGFRLRRIGARAVARLRVRPRAADPVGAALALPTAQGAWAEGDPAAGRLGPDWWWVVSERHAGPELAAQLTRELARGLPGTLHAATDLSAGQVCLELAGPAARRALAMGNGLDWHPDAFPEARCARTLLARVPLVIVARERDRFELYVENSLAPYLEAWFAAAGRDPLLRAASGAGQGRPRLS